MTLLENEAAQFRSADGEVKYSQATGNFQTLSLRQRRDGSFSGDTGKLHSFTQAVSPYLIAVTTRSRRVFHVKQMRVISPFPASTLPIYRQIMIFLDGIHLSEWFTMQFLWTTFCSRKFFRNMVRAWLEGISFNLCSSTSAPTSEHPLQNQLQMQMHTDLCERCIC